MPMKQTIEAYELLDSAFVNGETVIKAFRERGVQEASYETVHGEKGSTDIIHVRIPGKNGKSGGGNAPTLNIAGSLGGIGGRPELIGIVSDADGAVVAIASGLKIADMQHKGDVLEGDVIVRTNICPNAPTKRHDPVTFMSNWIETVELKKRIIDPTADGIVITETTRGNRVINHCGFAISPTIKEGWILRVSTDAIAIMERVTCKVAVVIPVTMQDITPSNNGIHHVNGLGVLPAGVRAPSIGVGLTAELPISGSAQGTSSVVTMEAAVRFVVEVAKEFGRGRFKFYDEEEFGKLTAMYGPMNHLQTHGKQGSV